MSYSHRLAVCQAYEIHEKGGVVVMTITAFGTRTAHFTLAPMGTMDAELALALETDRVAAIRSDDD